MKYILSACLLAVGCSIFSPDSSNTHGYSLIDIGSGGNDAGVDSGVVDSGNDSSDSSTNVRMNNSMEPSIGGSNNADGSIDAGVNNSAGAGGGSDSDAGVVINNIVSPCLDLFNQGNTVNNTYTISGNNIYCDMDHGGWALIYSTTNNNPHATENTTVVPNTSTYLSADVVKSLADQSHQVHIQTAGQWDTESITSTIDSQPIKDLRLLMDLSASSDNTVWEGPYNDDRIIGSYQGDLWPNIYHAAGNVNGIHIGPQLSGGTGSLSRWRFNGPDVAIEVYIK